MKKQTIKALAAGKLALTMSAGAGASGYGKVDANPTVGTLTLSQAGVPVDILTAPSNLGSKAGYGVAEGTLYTKLAANNRMDFMISGIRTDKPVYVYLAYSSGAARPDAWQSFTSGQGQLELEPFGLHILGAVALNQSNYIPLETPLGQVSAGDETIIIPVELGSLANLGEHGDSIYFQAFAFAVEEDGSVDWSSAQASELDKFIINRESLTNDDLEQVVSKAQGGENSGSGSGSGSKENTTSNPNSDTGSKYGDGNSGTSDSGSKYSAGEGAYGGGSGSKEGSGSSGGDSGDTGSKEEGDTGSGDTDSGDTGGK